MTNIIGYTTNDIGHMTKDTWQTTYGIWRRAHNKGHRAYIKRQTSSKAPLLMGLFAAWGILCQAQVASTSESLGSPCSCQRYLSQTCHDGRIPVSSSKPCFIITITFTCQSVPGSVDAVLPRKVIIDSLVSEISSGWFMQWSWRRGRGTSLASWPGT